MKKIDTTWKIFIGYLISDNPINLLYSNKPGFHRLYKSVGFKYINKENKKPKT